MSRKEGSLEAPTRHPLDWQSDDFYDQNKLDAELERVFDICHGCRRCVSLCNAFPTLFDLVDESETMEVDGVDKADYPKVVEQCYLCDLCYMTKCPYVPPHEWNVDFPHLMLRAKAASFKQQGAKFRDKLLTNTDGVSKVTSIPVIDVTVNWLNQQAPFRKLLESGFGIHKEAPLPQYHHKTMQKRLAKASRPIEPVAAGKTTGKVALFATCFGNYNRPDLGQDFFKVFQHNGIYIEVVPQAQCCGMPKLELGDLESVRQVKEFNIPILLALIEQGYDLIAPVPSCVLMFKQELPLMFPDDEDVLKVKNAFFDPFEYLQLRHANKLLKTDFKQSLGDVSYQVACHQRVQNIGHKTRDILSLIPDTRVHAIERCSGHDGTYAVKKETRDKSVKIARAVVNKVNQLKPQYHSSDCPMAATHISHLAEDAAAEHPMTLLRLAYAL